MHLVGTDRILAVPRTPLQVSGGARCRKDERCCALGETGESGRRYKKMVLLQEIRACQHAKHVGERLIRRYLGMDGTGQHPQQGATAAPVLQDKNDCGLPRLRFARVSHLHMSSLVPSRIGGRARVKQRSKQEK